MVVLAVTWSGHGDHQPTEWPGSPPDRGMDGPHHTPMSSMLSAKFWEIFWIWLAFCLSISTLYVMSGRHKVKLSFPILPYYSYREFHDLKLCDHWPLHIRESNWQKPHLILSWNDAISVYIWSQNKFLSQNVTLAQTLDNKKI